MADTLDHLDLYIAISPELHTVDPSFPVDHVPTYDLFHAKLGCSKATTSSELADIHHGYPLHTKVISVNLRTYTVESLRADPRLRPYTYRDTTEGEYGLVQNEQSLAQRAVDTLERCTLARHFARAPLENNIWFCVPDPGGRTRAAFDDLLMTSPGGSIGFDGAPEFVGYLGWILGV